VYHKLLERQIVKAKGAQETLLALVNEAYNEHDRDRRRVDHANHLMAEELEEKNLALNTLLDQSRVQNMCFSAALDNMPQAMCLFDKGGRLRVCNRKFIELYEFETDFDPVGLSLTKIFEHNCIFNRFVEMERRLLIMEHAALSVFRPMTIEQQWPSGRVISIARTPVEDGGFLAMIADVSEAHRANAQIVHMANYDALTDLPNRVLFVEKLNEAMRFTSRGEKSAVMCLDLDRFKAVNDTLGHSVGDALLLEVTKRLRQCIRDTDTVARLGGDEFAIIQRMINTAAEAKTLARRIISQISEPYLINGHQIVIGVSVGIEFVDRQRNLADEVLRNADLALYRAKSDGRGVYAVYKPELHASLDNRRKLEIELRHAIKAREFIVYYQPQYNTKSQKMCGFEALVRWESPSRGLVPPNEFIALSEEIGLIDELGRFVLHTACAEAATWPAHLTIAVNLSPVQFRSRRIVDVVRDVLKETGLAPHRLELEITESVMISETSLALAILNEMKGLGVKISLDDFGTGYSSLSYIRHFPLDKIKIDQCFIRDLGDSGDSLAIIRAVAGMCTSIGIVSTAEGVETQAQLDILRAENCDTIQGYLFSRPVPAEQARALIAQDKARYCDPTQDFKVA
jgi:diguanylate cyclase (GGDEF)-like protein